MIQVRLHPRNNWLKESGYSREEEIKLFDDQLKDLLDNTRWYLDRIETMKTYRVFWQDYKSKKATAPFIFGKHYNKQPTPKPL